MWQASPDSNYTSCRVYFNHVIATYIFLTQKRGVLSPYITLQIINRAVVRVTHRVLCLNILAAFLNSNVLTEGEDVSVKSYLTRTLNPAAPCEGAHGNSPTYSPRLWNPVWLTGTSTLHTLSCGTSLHSLSYWNQSALTELWSPSLHSLEQPHSKAPHQPG